MKSFKQYGKSRFNLLLIAAALISGLGSFLAPMNTSAIGDWAPYGGYSEGYFSNNGVADVNNRQWCEPSGTEKCPVLRNGNYATTSLNEGYFRNGSIPSATRASQLITDIQGKYNSGDGWDRAGAAFIANTMLGRESNTASKSRNISNAEWDNLRERMVSHANKGQINWDGWINANGMNTLMQRINGQYDVMYQQNNEGRVGLQITNDDGSVAYRLWYSCANPIGNFSGLAVPPTPSTNWSVNGQSYVKKANALGASGFNYDKPGSQTGTITGYPKETIAWYHDLRNNPSSNTNASVYFQVEKTGGFPAAYNTQPNGSASGGPNSLFVHEYAGYSKPSTGQLRYLLDEKDLGKTLCQRIIWLPGSSTNPSWAGAESGGACVKVEYDFELDPKVTLNVPSAEPGTKLPPITNVVENNGKTKSTPNAEWKFVEVRVNPGVPIPQTGDTTRSNPTVPCTYYQTPGVSCSTPAGLEGTQPGGFATTPTGLPSLNDYVIPDLPVGTKICFGLSVRPDKTGSNNWKHSALQCVVINKKPSINVTGGDVIVGRGSSTDPKNVVTSTSNKEVDGATRTFGSWSEYGLIANGTVTGMASGAGYSGGAESLADKFCQVSTITITNANKSGSTLCNAAGGYPVNETAPAIGSAFVTNKGALTGSVDLGSKETGVYSATGTLTIDTSVISKGQYVVINAPTANVIVNGNITYNAGNISQISEIPQVVIIANNIQINGGVERVDSWLIASGNSGRIQTCEVASFAVLTSTVCDKPLRVNGPVVAKKLFLYRTAGASTGVETKQPAETFNLRPDAYLWATSYRSDSAARLQTTKTKELPPRY